MMTACLMSTLTKKPVPTVRPAAYGQMTKAGWKLTDLPQPDLEDSGLLELGVLTDLLPSS
jgi:hypothetical protein